MNPQLASQLGKHSFKDTGYNKYSSFWLGDSLTKHYNNNNIETLIKLNSIKKAVSNFVKITTGQQIPIEFKGNNSYTDSKKIVISAETDDFDVTVGLALHEASHIVKSDFKLLYRLVGYTNSLYYVAKSKQKISVSSIPFELMETNIQKLFTNVKINNDTRKIIEILKLVKNVFNYVEDRRIDFWQYSVSPGYNGYYKSLYNKYFYSSEIDKGLNSNNFRKENVNSYLFRLINIHNPESDLTALNGLNEIYKILDLNNISRLNNSLDALKVSVDIVEVIINNINTENESNKQKDKNKNQDSKNQDSDDSKNQDSDDSENQDSDDSENQDSDDSENQDSDDSENQDSDDSENQDSDDSENQDSDDSENQDSDDSENQDSDDSENQDSDDSENQDSGDSKNQDSGKNDTSDTNYSNLDDDNSENEEEQELEQELEKILNRLDHSNDPINKNKLDAEKKELDDDTISKLKSLESSGAEYKTVPYNGESAKILKLDNFDMNLIKSFPRIFNEYGDDSIQRAVNEGLNNGKILGKKLKIRNDDKVITHTRKKDGILDKRLISELGYNNSRVFIKRRKIVNNDIFMHITIDNSGSMSGLRINNALKMAATIAQAASMIDGFRVVISLRSDFYESGGGSLPFIVKVYDSNKDKIVKIKTLFKYIDTPGSTPEGLCFDAILEDIIKVGKHTDSYFVNMSDGHPGATYETVDGKYGDYTGQSAVDHTAQVVKKIIKNGVHVISYLLSDSNKYGYVDSDYFNQMYGKDSHVIDPNNLTALAVSINNKFAKAANR